MNNVISTFNQSITLNQEPQALARDLVVAELKILSHRISAGFPSPAGDYAEDGLDLNNYLVQNKPATFMFTVRGESMIDAAICDGDYVVIRQQKDANNGEIVAAMIDGEATVKTFSRKSGHIWLLPANENFAPIDGDQCEILGKVTAVLRSVR